VNGRGGVVDVAGGTKGICPEMSGNHDGPFVDGVEERCTRGVLKVANPLLSNAVLEVGVYAAVGVVLMLFVAVSNPVIVGKAAVVSVVVSDGEAAFLGKDFKLMFSKEVVGTGESGLEVDVGEAGILVDEDGGVMVAFLGEAAFELLHETVSGCGELVY
jgi:hypothetical protein